jgi:thiamine-monophosphate kinase
MRLFQTGELRLLKEVRERFRLSPDEKGVVVGIGDDAAVIAPHHKKTIITTDMMNEGIHFELGYTSPFHLGFKLVSVNVSDIMAMGGVPKYLFIDLAFTHEADDEVFSGIYDGIEQAMSLYGVQLLGGDLCAARSDTVLSATVIGEGERIVTRSGAAPGDRIYLTSSTGDSACGLEILRLLNDEGKDRIKKVRYGRENVETGGYHNAPLQKSEGEPEELKLNKDDGLVTLKWEIAGPLLVRHLMPVARDSRDIAPYASAMIDVSDGLFIDLCRICDESGTGAIIYHDKIPLSKEIKEASELLGRDPFNFASSGGEDYEILFTAPDFPVESYNRAHDTKVSCIGEITHEERAVINKEGRKSALKAEGYQHFGLPG